MMIALSTILGPSPWFSENNSCSKESFLEMSGLDETFGFCIWFHCYSSLLSKCCKDSVFSEGKKSEAYVECQLKDKKCSLSNCQK